uniref:sugar efflux transporter n=1 Tax=Thaumasiovibrio occultus TaxID=1891184 RepID=UPI000B3542D6|nr:sugar efflux transporter [Thaumasiovibrio occultus]
MSRILLPESAKFFIINGLTAFAFTFMMPIIPLFLINGLQASPIAIAKFTFATSVAGLFFVRAIGRLSDDGVNDKLLYGVTVIAIVLSGLGFALVESFWQAMVVGCVVFALARASLSQVLAMIRKYAVQTNRSGVKFNAQMRSAISMVWVVGPPLAFMVVAQWGYRVSFLISAVLAVVVMLLAAMWLPDTTSRQHKAANAAATSTFNPVIWSLIGLCFFGCLANSIYINAIAIYVTTELGLGEHVPGLLLGLAAGLEIPVMLLVGRWAVKYGTVRLLSFAFGCAFLFYVSLQVATGLPGLLLAQIFNGTFFGIFIGLAVSLFQDEMPSKPGQASALYSNCMTLAGMFGGAIPGVIAQWWSFKASLQVSLVAIVIAGGCLLAYKMMSGGDESDTPLTAE